MRMWMLACGAVTLAGFLAVPASAQEPIALPQTVISSPQPVMVVQQQRGLFGRARARREMVTYTYQQPLTTTTAGTMTASGTTTASGTGTTGSGIQQAQFTQPAPQTTTQAGAMPPQTQVAETPVVERRLGLFARMRARRN